MGGSPNRESGPGRVTVVLLIGLVILAAGGWNILRKAVVPVHQDGLTCVDTAGGVKVVRVSPGSAATLAGISAGDIITAVDGVPVSSVVEYGKVRSAAPPGQTTHVYSTLRAGTSANHIIELAEQPDGTALYYILATVGLVFLHLGLFVGIFGRDAADGLLFTAVCLTFAAVLIFSPIGLYDTVDIWFNGADDAATVLLPAMFLAFCLLFPLRQTSHGGSAPGPAARAAGWGASAASLVLLLLFAGWYAGQHFFPGNPYTTPSLYNFLRRLSLVWLGTGMVLGGGLLTVRPLRAREPILRQQLLWVGMGALVGGLPPLLLYFLPYLAGHYPGRLQELSILTLAWTPVAFSRAVRRYRLADAQIVFKRSMVFAFSTALTLVVLLAGLAWSRRLFPGLSAPGSTGAMALWATAAVAASVLFFPRIRNTLLRGADRIHYGALSSERLKLAAFDPFKLDPSLSPDRMAAAFVAEVRRALGVEHIRYFDPENLPAGIEDPAVPPGGRRDPWNGEDRTGSDSPACGEGGEGAETAPLDEPGSTEGMKRIRLVELEQPLDGLYQFLVMSSRGNGRLLGAIGFGPGEGRNLLSSEDLRTLLPAAELLAMALENRALSRQIMAQQRRVSIGQLAAGVAHEINTPLTGISSYTQMLLENVAEAGGPGRVGGGTGVRPDEQTDLLQKIGQQAERAGQIVSSLLHFSRQGMGQMVPADLNDTVEQAVSLFQHRLKETAVDFTLHLSPEPLPIKGDPPRLQQVLINLIDNALDAMPGGGRLELSTTVRDGWATIDVADTGEGIAAETRSRIFDPFFTTKTAGRGTGLGLSICYGIIRRHEGDISFRSEVGRGTVFTLRLPLRHARSDRLRGEAGIPG